VTQNPHRPVGIKVTDEDFKDFKKIQEAQPTIGDIQSVCPDVKVDQNGQVSGSAKGRDQVLAVREMYMKQNALKGARDSKKAEKSHWVNLRDRNGKTREVRARNAEHVAKRHGLYEPVSWGKGTLRLTEDGTWWKRKGDQWFVMDPQPQKRPFW